MDTTRLFKLICEYRRPQVVAEVVGLSGSAPRHISSRILIRENGSSFGSVGGGIVEAKTIEAARHCFVDRSSRAIQVRMLGEADGDIDPICGGIIDIALEYLEDTTLYERTLEYLAKGQPVLAVSGSKSPTIGLLALILSGDEDGGLQIVEKRSSEFHPDPDAVHSVLSKGKPVISPVDAMLYERILPQERLLILGGGYVGRSLALAAEGLGFEITVADFRAQFSAPERFPSDVAAIHAPFLEVIDGYEFDMYTYVVVVSPGHAYDFECVRAILEKPYRYAGFIGSKAKTRSVLTRLVAMGFPLKKVEALCAPIGIDIGAETPQEIAISILAEIIAVRRNSPAAEAIASDRPRRRGIDYHLY